MSKVQINYKSGHAVIFDCDEFAATRKGASLDAIDWKLHLDQSKRKNRPLFFGDLGDVESIWELLDE